MVHEQGEAVQGLAQNWLVSAAASSHAAARQKGVGPAWCSHCCRGLACTRLLAVCESGNWGKQWGKEGGPGQKSINECAKGERESETG